MTFKGLAFKRNAALAESFAMLWPREGGEPVASRGNEAAVARAGLVLPQGSVKVDWAERNPLTPTFCLSWG